MAASGTTLVDDLARGQKTRLTGTRRHIDTGLHVRVILLLSLIVAPTLTALWAVRGALLAELGNALLLATAGAAWLVLAIAAMRCLRRRLAWQSGFLIVHPRLGKERLVPMSEIAQVRLARRGYRLFLCDGSNIHVYLADRGARDLLAAIMDEVAARKARPADAASPPCRDGAEACPKVGR